jgi:hypothetical protein
MSITLGNDQPVGVQRGPHPLAVKLVAVPGEGLSACGLAHERCP